MKKYPVLTRYTLALPVPEPFSFAFLSDLHECEPEPVLTALRSLSPDAVFVGGDFVHGENACQNGKQILKAASRLAPLFASVGNHERGAGLALFPFFRETGGTLLDNSFTVFRGITVGGLSSGFSLCGKQGNRKETPAPDFAFLSCFAAEPGVKILLSHHPEYYPAYIRPLPVDLTLSGHAHGGQWRFFGHGVFAPGQGIFPKYTSGCYDGGRLVVSRGLGNKSPVPRLFNPTEIISIRIEPRSSPADGNSQRK